MNRRGREHLDDGFGISPMRPPTRGWPELFPLTSATSFPPGFDCPELAPDSLSTMMFPASSPPLGSITKRELQRIGSRVRIRRLALLRREHVEPARVEGMGARRAIRHPRGWLLRRQGARPGSRLGGARSVLVLPGGDGTARKAVVAPPGILCANRPPGDGPALRAPEEGLGPHRRPPARAPGAARQRGVQRCSSQATRSRRGRCPRWPSPRR